MDDEFVLPLPDTTDDSDGESSGDEGGSLSFGVGGVENGVRVTFLEEPVLPTAEDILHGDSSVMLGAGSIAAGANSSAESSALLSGVDEPVDGRAQEVPYEEFLEELMHSDGTHDAAHPGRIIVEESTTRDIDAAGNVRTTHDAAGPDHAADATNECQIRMLATSASYIRVTNVVSLRKFVMQSRALAVDMHTLSDAVIKCDGAFRGLALSETPPPDATADSPPRSRTRRRQTVVVTEVSAASAAEASAAAANVVNDSDDGDGVVPNELVPPTRTVLRSSSPQRTMTGKRKRAYAKRRLQATAAKAAAVSRATMPEAAAASPGAKLKPAVVPRATTAKAAAVTGRTTKTAVDTPSAATAKAMAKTNKATENKTSLSTAKKRALEKETEKAGRPRKVRKRAKIVCQAKKAESGNDSSSAGEEDEDVNVTNDGGDPDESINGNGAEWKSWKKKTEQAKMMVLQREYIKTNGLEEFLKPVLKCGEGGGVYIKVCAPVNFSPLVVEEFKRKATISYNECLKSVKKKRFITFVERPPGEGNSDTEEPEDVDGDSEVMHSVPKHVGALAYAMRRMSSLLVKFIRRHFVDNSELLAIVNVIPIKSIHYSCQLIESQQAPYSEILTTCTDCFSTKFNALSELQKKIVLAETAHRLYDNFVIRVKRHPKAK